MAGEITTLLHRWQRSEEGAADTLFSRVHRELLEMASIKLVSERQGHTLEPAALVNETFLKLIREGRLAWNDRKHFFAIASKQMWRVLADHGRRRHSKKRGEAQVLLPLPDDIPAVGEKRDDCVAINEALEALGRVHQRSARVVHLRFFGGMTWAEVARRVGTSVATSKNDWAYGKAFLFGRFSNP